MLRSLIRRARLFEVSTVSSHASLRRSVQGPSCRPLRVEPLEDRRLLSLFCSSDVPETLDAETVMSTLSVPDSLTITDIDVQVNITRSDDSDLDVFPIAADSTREELLTDVGGSEGDSSSTIFDDEATTPITSGSAPFAGSFQPEGSLSTLDGKDAQGTWTPEFTDDLGGGDRTLNSRSISVENSASSFPYLESFESGLGDWAQGTGDDGNWTQKSGPTTSSATGPSAAHDGNWYM